MKKLFIVLFSVLAAFSSCDIIEGPYDEAIVIDSVKGPVRKVLIEDYTGHQCGNCPCAADSAVSLYNRYKGRVVIVATHIGFFARTNPSGKFSYDFKTQTGNELDAFFQIDNVGLPRGLVNRKVYDGNLIMNPTAWGSALYAILDQDGTPGVDTSAPPIIIKIDQDYNAGTRTVTADIEIEYNEAGNNNQNLVFYIVEDSIKNWQLYYPQCSPTGANYETADYYHRHVLRGSVNGTWGEQVSGSTNIPKGTKITKTYSKVLDPSWNDKQIYLVAFVHDNVTKEVLQVEEVHLK